MIKAIFYKEWIKTQWVLLLSTLILLGVTTFLAFNLHRMIALKGAVHIWEVMIQRDALFISMITFVPTVLGLLVALTQYVPEMQRKSLKLTLHLPYHSTKMIAHMVAFGVITLGILFLLSWGIFYVTMSMVLAKELVQHILLTSLVWYSAGIFSYLATSWIVLEPTWKRRALNSLVALLLLKIYFMSGTGGAYNSFLPILILFTLLSASLTFLSVARFKEGKQD
ncbi:MAG: hypothetical protein ACRCUJ_11425 [Phocaeicola sp.]